MRAGAAVCQIPLDSHGWEEFINQEEAMKLAGENPDIAGQGPV